MLFYFRLAFWTLFWSLLWPIMQIFRKKGQHNCITWAINEWEQKDGYIVIRWCRSSKYSWLRWPHFLFLDQEHHENLRHFLPDDTSDLDKKLIPDMWFHGTEKSGDHPDDSDEN